jgi:hypothetical protein
MGVWGTGPFDSDDAGDMVGRLLTPILRVVHADQEASYDYEAARCAAVFVLAAHGTDILGGPNLSLVLRAMTRIRRDTEWLSGWSSPKRIAKAVDDQIREVVARMKACKGCKKSAAKDSHEQLFEDAESAMRSAVPSRRRRSPKAVRMTRARGKRSKGKRRS